MVGQTGGRNGCHLWAGACLAALAISLDSEFTTFDRGFKSFPGLRLNLLEIA